MSIFCSKASNGSPFYSEQSFKTLQWSLSIKGWQSIIFLSLSLITLFHYITNLLALLFFKISSMPTASGPLHLLFFFSVQNTSACVSVHGSKVNFSSKSFQTTLFKTGPLPTCQVPLIPLLFNFSSSAYYLFIYCIFYLFMFYTPPLKCRLLEGRQICLF